MKWDACSSTRKVDRKENINTVRITEKAKKAKEVEGLLIFATRDGKEISREDVFKEFRQKRLHWKESIAKDV
jgi:hypothetical protein